MLKFWWFLGLSVRHITLTSAFFTGYSSYVHVCLLFLEEQQSYWLAQHPHFNLIISVKILFPNKLHSEILEVKTPTHECLKDTLECIKMSFTKICICYQSFKRKIDIP